MDSGYTEIGMIYLMTSRYNQPSKPSDRYVGTILQGYNDCELDIDELYNALEYNKEELGDEE